MILILKLQTLGTIRFAKEASEENFEQMEGATYITSFVKFHCADRRSTVGTSAALRIS
jgi:hypothetical protein